MPLSHPDANLIQADNYSAATANTFSSWVVVDRNGWGKADVLVTNTDLEAIPAGSKLTFEEDAGNVTVMVRDELGEIFWAGYATLTTP